MGNPMPKKMVCISRCTTNKLGEFESDRKNLKKMFYYNLSSAFLTHNELK